MPRSVLGVRRRRGVDVGLNCRGDDGRAVGMDIKVRLLVVVG
jgi:hypothetical protein